MQRLFVLRQQLQLDAVTALLRQNWTAFANAGKPLAVRVAIYRATRNSEQNARYWAILTQIANDAWVNGQQYSPETWHEHFKRELLPDTFENGTEKWAYLPSSERALVGSTTDLNTAEFATYTDQIEAYAATELGVTIVHKEKH